MRVIKGRQFGKAIGAASIALAAMATSVALSTPAFASSSGDLAAATNSARANVGLAGLSVNANLSSVAQAWANKLAASGVLSHNGALRSQVSGWSVLGENVGMAGDIPSVQQAFMNSAPHKANILDPRYTQMGVGSATSTDAQCNCQVIWVVVDFRRPTTVAAAPAPVVPKPAPVVKPVVVKPVPVTPVATKPAASKTAATSVRPSSVATTTTPASPVTAVAVPTAVEPSATASASALSTQLAATASPVGVGDIAADPISRVLTFATVMSQLPAA